MIRKDILSELKDDIQRINNREGMNQYLLLIDSDDIIFSRDLVVLNILNSSYHGLSPYEYNVAVSRTLELLKEGTNSEVIDIVLGDGGIEFKPLIINKFDTTNEFFLLSKKKSGFILKEIYDTYFYDIDDIKITTNIFINPNASGLLSSDANFVIYDDNDKISKSVLLEFSRMFHRNRLIPSSKLEEFIMDNILEHNSRIDFITNDISRIIDKLFISIIEKLSKLVDNGTITENKARNCFKTNSVIGGVTMYNIDRLSTIDPHNKPGYNIGLTPIFSKRT